ncbi:MAG: hypothetical protein KC593_10250 [Myxococcales bacterium]|nr:hypothetical protein [Myxococcales bacterium]MCB9629859.1 hypothetical protein [Sandaracinaceae bacterium]
MNIDFDEQGTRTNIESATKAFQVSDLSSALFHASSVLSVDPQHAAMRGILDQIVARVGADALTLVRTDQAKFDYITVATRAYLQAKLGNGQEAFRELCFVVNLRPDVPFFVWGAEWAAEGKLNGMSTEDTVKLVVIPTLRWLSECPSPVADDDYRKPNVLAAVRVMTILRQLHPQEPMVLMAASSALRRAGDFVPAIQLAEQCHQLDKKWSTAIMVATAHRDAGGIDRAVEWYRYSLSLEGADPISTQLDIGDTLLGAQRWDDAIAAYRDVLQQNPKHRHAESSITYAEYKKTGNAELKFALYDQAEHSGRAWQLLCDMEPQRDYVHFLPGPGDASANALRNLVRDLTQHPERGQGGNLDMKSTYPESPSVLLAWERWAKDRGFQVGVKITTEKTTSPDPRSPRGQVAFSLWRFDAQRGYPNVPAPDPRVVDAVAAIARETFLFERWDKKAKPLGAQMGPAWVEQLLSLMVHPAPVPEGMDPFTWVLRLQVATALVIGRTDNSWSDAQGRKFALFNVARGPVDWTSQAAIMVLAWLTRDEPNLRADVEALFTELRASIPRESFTSYERPLIMSWLGMGGHDDAKMKMFSDWLYDYDERHTQRQEEEKHEGLTIAQYAELSARRDAITTKHAHHAGGRMAFVANALGNQQWSELEKLCREYGLKADNAAASGRIEGWETRLRNDKRLRAFFEQQVNLTRLKLEGIDPNSHEGRIAEQIRGGHFDVEGARVNAQAVAAAAAAGEDMGDPDPVVFPGQPVAKLSDYVKMMKHMQTGDMNGALKMYGLNMASYGGVAQAWGVKLASDPTLTAKFSKMMA